MILRLLKILALLLASWCVMVLTHESGHVIAGWLTGGKLQQADLRPWHLPYSFFQPNPRPLITLWSGPLLGAIFPVLLALVFKRDWLWFIANFCLLANGAYLALAWLFPDPMLDTTKLFAHGAHPVTVALYSLVTIGFGYTGFRRSCRRIFQTGETDEPRHPKDPNPSDPKRAGSDSDA